MPERPSRTPPDGGDEGLPSGLLRLAIEPDRVTPVKLWRALAPEQRKAVAEAVLAEPDAEALADFMRHRISEARGFREKTVRGWPDQKVAQHARALDLDNGGAIRDALRTFHFAQRRDLMAEFLDAAGLKHERGQFSDRALEQLAAEQPLPGDTFQEAAEGVLKRYPADQVVLYLLTLRCFHPGLGPGLDPWLRNLAHPAVGDGATAQAEKEGAGLAPVPPERPDEEAEAGKPDPGPERTAGFTTLDRQLIRTAVDTVQEVEGALDVDELDDLVSEVIELNSTRHQSYFHAGFVDALLRREAERDLPAENRDRKAWYWAGYISGMARRGEWDAVADLHDEVEGVDELWGSGSPPVDAAGVAVGVLLKALLRADRGAEAADRLSAWRVARQTALLKPLADEGQRLLRENRAPEARRIYDLLGDATRGLEAEGHDVRTGPFLEIRRRRAHCHRQLGETAQARELLERLLEEERDPEIRARVLADLGLVDAGFRSLADLEVPESADARPEMKKALERGRGRFEESLDIGSRSAGHGAFGLGVLTFLEAAISGGDGHWKEVARHLESALSLFEAKPEHYRHRGLLGRTRLYLGAALLLSLDESRSLEASQLMERGLREGGTLPADLLDHVIAAAAAVSRERAVRVAEAFVRGQGLEALDAVEGTVPVEGSEELATAMLERGRDRSYPPGARAETLRAVTPALLRQDRTEEAGEALDLLEDLAYAGTDREGYLEFLASPDNYEPAWEVDDSLWSRITVLEAAGDYERATACLEDVFHPLLSHGNVGAEEDAETILSRIREYPYGMEERLEFLESRLMNWRTERGLDTDEPAGTTAPGRLVRVLFVGGDERQAKQAEQVEAMVRARDEQVRVRFIHPGWSGNWALHLEEVEGELPHQDALVLMRFMRTELGRSIRRKATIPWKGCYGAGREQMVRSILLAAEMGRAAKG